uniref:Uncharacterized protein n=1 Tax=Thraustochytrium aureum TaxID=42467 RepID=Q947G9_9STRA|nr:unknown [Thraustochytrium aureum]
MDYFNKIANQEKSYTKKVRQEETAAKRAQQRAEKQRQKEMENVDDYTDDAGEDSANRKPLKKKPAQAPTMPPPTPAPTSKFTAPDETVYDFLYKHTDGSLIMHSVSVEEEESIPQNELNVITLTIQAMAAHSDDSLALAQVAVWFAKIAQAWPMDVDLSQNAVGLASSCLIEMDLDNLENLLRSFRARAWWTLSDDRTRRQVLSPGGFKPSKEATSPVQGYTPVLRCGWRCDAAEIPETKRSALRSRRSKRWSRGSWTPARSRGASRLSGCGPRWRPTRRWRSGKSFSSLRSPWQRPSRSSRSTSRSGAVARASSRSC